MAKNFRDPRAGMSLAAPEVSDAEHRRLMEQMSLHPLRKARELTKDRRGIAYGTCM